MSLDEERELIRLLAAWRELPARATGDAIVALGPRAAAEVHAPAGTTDEDREHAWQAEATKRDPIMRQRLLETICDAPEPAARVGRIAALVGERDPRVSRMIVEMIATERYLDLYVKEFWNPMFALLEQCGDPDARARVAAIDWTEKRRRLGGGAKKAFDARLAKLTDRLAVVYPDPAPEGEPLPSIAPIAAPENPALLAAVYASPAEDAPRAIYADWLQEHDDPRGELIALQLAGRDPDRVEHLLSIHQARWLEPIAASIGSIEFERGFLASCTVYRAVAPHPIWSTVTAIRGAIPASDEYPMPVLQRALDVEPTALATLATLATPPPLVELGCRAITEEVLARLPLLRTLRLAGSFGELEGWLPIAARVATFELDCKDSWLVTVVGSRFTFTRGHHRARWAQDLEQICSLLEKVPVVSYVRFGVTRDAWTIAHRNRVKRVLEIHPTLSIEGMS